MFEIEVIPMTATTKEEAIAEMQHMMDNCPLCIEARARGEVPQIVTGDDLLRPRGIDRFRRPRWRDLKRRVKRR